MQDGGNSNKRGRDQICKWNEKTHTKKKKKKKIKWPTDHLGWHFQSGHFHSKISQKLKKKKKKPKEQCFINLNSLI